ncbi:MAG: hypothetical protein KBT13_12410 [Bacteroidales bacterium]|nr:hypothetical protein [Candidatus Sodaliphilus limicaballi]
MRKKKRGTMSLSIINEASPNALTEIEQPHPHANTYIAPRLWRWAYKHDEGVSSCLNAFG